MLMSIKKYPRAKGLFEEVVQLNSKVKTKAHS